MLTESCRVVAVEPGWVWVETSRDLTCDGGALANMSGMVTLNFSGERPHSYLKLSTGVFPHDFFKVDDQVAVVVPERYLPDSALLVYGVPLLTTLACVALAKLFLPNATDAETVLGAILGYTGGLLLVRLHTWLLGKGCDLRPRLIGLSSKG